MSSLYTTFFVQRDCAIIRCAWAKARGVQRQMSSEAGGVKKGRELRIIIPVTLCAAVIIFIGLLFFSPLGRILGRFAQTHADTPIRIVSKTEDVPDWKKQERINILLLGVDRRPEEINSPTRTDTMLIVTIDPYSKTAGILSIPRDLWVPIPLSDSDMKYDRINTAYFFGDLHKYPGGGPALAEKAIEYSLPGVNIHYYAVVDFEGFARIIDTLGGITVYLDGPLVDHQYPTPDYGVMTVYIPAGEQHLDGEETLWYARSRYQGGDIGRMKRQQQILLAMREKILQLNILPKLPQLASQFADVVKTDLSITELRRLGDLAKSIRSEDIASYSLDMNYVTRTFIGEADVLVLKNEKASELIQEVFCDVRLREEDARVEVLNGTTWPGLAAETAAFLESQGIAEVDYGDATDGVAHQETTIYSPTGKDYTAGLIAALLNLPKNRIERKQFPASSADISVVLGEDAEAPRGAISAD